MTSNDEHDFREDFLEFIEFARNHPKGFDDADVRLSLSDRSVDPVIIDYMDNAGDKSQADQHVGNELGRIEKTARQVFGTGRVAPIRIIAFSEAKEDSWKWHIEIR
jgi:hypothetical protein